MLFRNLHLSRDIDWMPEVFSMVVGVVVPKWLSLRRCNAQPGMSMARCQQAKLTRARVRHARTRMNFGDRLQKKGLHFRAILILKSDTDRSLQNLVCGKGKLDDE